MSTSNIFPYNRRRILFFAEAATLAHVARPMVLAQALEKAGYDVYFACNPTYQNLFDPLSRPWISIKSISSEEFLEALAKGRPLYRQEQLRDYVEEDLRVIDQVSPDLIVGDFRLSLSISARISNIHYMTITNAYWSPYARPNYIVPELPITRILGPGVANTMFRLARPLAFALHSIPLNRLRKEYGLSSLGLDLRRTYTDADTVLYADIPEAIPTYDRPSTHHYIGPFTWSPAVELPSWWPEIPKDKPIIYVTLGSSGQSELLPTILSSLEKLPAIIVIATAGRNKLKDLPTNVFIADYLPGDVIAQCATLVVCNGGSPTTMQALALGVPVIGIPSNLDQFLNMSYMQLAGVGLMLRARDINNGALQQVARDVMDSKSSRNRARLFMNEIKKYASHKRFSSLVDRHFLTHPEKANPSP